MSKISKRPEPEDREEGQASDGDSHPVQRRQRNGLSKVNDRSRAERRECVRKRALEEGIEIGKKESADKIKQQDTRIKEQTSQIKKLTEQLAQEAAHLLLANQLSDLLTEQLAQKKEEVVTVTGHNAQLRSELAAFVVFEFLCPSQNSAGDGSG